MSSGLHQSHTRMRRFAGAVALAAATGLSWWVCTTIGGYQGWSVAASALLLLLVGITAVRWLPVAVVVAVMPTAFTMTWIVTAAARDSTGLWPIGAVLVIVGALGSLPVIAAIATVADRWWHRGGA